MKIINKGVLNFICKNIFYSDKRFKTNKIFRHLDVFNGVDISSLKDNYYNYWEKICFKNMFEKKATDFSIKIASLVREIKDFGLLFKLFKTDREEPINDYGVTLEKRFIELLKTYSIKACPNFINDKSKWIYIVDKKKISPENFLKDNIGQLNAEVVNNININSKFISWITTKFSNDIKDILNILLNNKDINNIKKRKEILYQYGIDINNKNNIINILLKLKQQPDSCILLSTSTIQDCRILQELSLEI